MRFAVTLYLRRRSRVLTRYRRALYTRTTPCPKRSWASCVPAPPRSSEAQLRPPSVTRRTRVYSWCSTSISRIRCVSTSTAASCLSLTTYPANAVSSAPNAAGLPIPISTSAAVNSVSAASAGALATLATQPFDVLKTKMQVRSEVKYRGLLSTVSAIWRVSAFVYV